ncbi:MAG: hypothetical protein ACYTFN_23030 [Planctomycetota bacterium]|jgi:hypothetical protein
MTRPATVAATLLAVVLALALPVAAQAPVTTELGTLWGLPSGSNPTEEHNRNANLVRRANLWRAPIEITLDGNFSASSGNVILQHGRTYEQAFTLAKKHGYRVLLCFLIHASGSPDGTDYHGANGGRGPILNSSTIDKFVGQFMKWLPPGVKVYGWQLGNEVAYDPKRTPNLFNQWWSCWEKIKPRFPSSWVRVSPGNSGFVKEKGQFTLNGWLADTGRAKANKMVLDVHGNGKDNNTFKNHLQAIPKAYAGVVVGCYEDRHPASDHSHAKERAQICRDVGCVVYFPFGARDSGNPPLSTCRWGVRPTGKKNRSHIGVEGCGRKWNAKNLSELTDASKLLGVFVPGVDLPVVVPFWADTHQLSLRSGGTQKLTMNAGKTHANRLYWIVGSVSGTSPGINLSGVSIPLNPDPYTDFTIANTNSTILTNFRGGLDTEGNATASFNVPSGLPPLVPFTVYHACLVYDTQGRFYMASNPVPLALGN